MNFSTIVGLTCYGLSVVLLAIQFFQDSLVPDYGFLIAAFGSAVIGTLWFVITTLENMNE